MRGIFYNDLVESHLVLILKEIYYDRIYDPFVKDRKDMFIVDAGANIGLTASYFSDYASRVIAIEPCAAHRECLASMIVQNEMQNISLLAGGLSPESGHARLYHNKNSTMHSFVAAESFDEYEDVPVYSLPAVMKRYGLTHIDLLKLDVEGLESEILESPSFASVAGNIDMIIGEWHDWTRLRKVEIEGLLASYGFAGGWHGEADSSIFFGTRIKP